MSVSVPVRSESVRLSKPTPAEGHFVPGSEEYNEITYTKKDNLYSTNCK